MEARLTAGPELVHRLALQADEKCEGIAAFFDAGALGHYPGQAVRVGTLGAATSPDAILHIRDTNALFGTLRQVDSYLGHVRLPLTPWNRLFSG